MNELDLHGFTHDEAVLAAENFVLMESQKPLFQCKVITGNSSNMSRKITNMLEQHGFHYYIPSWNIGEIVISD
jgi:DNA-nicking Smr family endonuclease